MMVGLMWNWSFPINKSLWTSSYVVFSRRHGRRRDRNDHVDRRRHIACKRWTKPFVIYGMNPMVAFVGSGVMARCIYSIFTVNYQGKRIPLEAGIYQRLFRSWLEPVNASLAFASPSCCSGLGFCPCSTRRNLLQGVSARFLDVATASAVPMLPVCTACDSTDHLRASPALLPSPGSGTSSRRLRRAQTRTAKRVGDRHARRRGEASRVCDSRRRGARRADAERGVAGLSSSVGVGAVAATRAAASGARSSCRSRAATRSSRRTPTR